ncbi:hypothetical protein BaRGS_00022538 [Batillaria attramentaria]|uniref:Uncharacterized protein n=1 Tax=Batillaria attramentaria TaxID=370345 RepID=A0ABD0KGV1_9CAEN
MGQSGDIYARSVQTGYSHSGSSLFNRANHSDKAVKLADCSKARQSGELCQGFCPSFAVRGTRSKKRLATGITEISWQRGLKVHLSSFEKKAGTWPGDRGSPGRQGV